MTSKEVPTTEFPRSIGKVAARELALAGYTRLEHLAQVSKKSLLALHGVGPKSLNILEDELKRRGLRYECGKEREMSISVRRAESRDLEFVSQEGYLSPDVLEQKVEQGEVFLAEIEGTPAGYLRLEFLWSTQPYIALIRVIDPYRRRGVGAAMLSYVQDVLRSSGHSSLLSSSQADEAEPQAWHRHMGFTECGIINGLNEGGVGEIFFRKLL